jgi:uncharacterized membrane protein
VAQLVEGLIPGGFSGIFHWLNLSGLTIVLWSMQSVTEVTTTDISWRVKAAGA